ncbi:hypothetical protein [Hymenobacter convexus]|uniref:hypothetical protein n=1 Tax=Hymenobacter sp. CA1UV-4 TaxID=3063782 RepID=UPI0027299E4F|nr:hypothetical protein [Hymenobacter sp. CA1UV-4]
MSPSFEEFYHEVARDYGSMWDFKFRGRSLEIITPHSTISDKFVSVFLTERGQEIIVSDGGYLYLGEYIENEDVQQNKCYNQTVTHLEDYYKVQRVLDRHEKVIFYLKTQRRDLVSSLVHDMASFITGVVNAQQITLESDREVETRQRFAKKAGSFLIDVFPARMVKFHQPLRVGDRINFSAGIWRESKVNLIQFVTGSTPYHFANSMAKATMNFLAVGGSALAPSVNHKVSFIDTSASGYRTNGNPSYASLLNGASEVLAWEERARIVEMVEAPLE